MVHISRRSFFSHVAGAGGLVLAGAAPTAAQRAPNTLYGIRAVCRGRSWVPRLGYFICLEVQRADGSWQTLRRPFDRAALFPYCLDGASPRCPHVRPGERLTFLGVAPFQRKTAFKVANILNYNEEPLLYATLLEPWKDVRNRVMPARARARAQGLDYEAEQATVLAAVLAVPL